MELRIENQARGMRIISGDTAKQRRLLLNELIRIAEKEGFEEIAKTFESIAVAEAYHEKRFMALMENIKKGKVFKKDGSVKWRCRNCGYNHTGSEAPEICPACAHAKAHFELLDENY